MCLLFVFVMIFRFYSNGTYMHPNNNFLNKFHQHLLFLFVDLSHSAAIYFYCSHLIEF